MKIFIWERVENLTDSYHHEGGLVIVAESLNDARALYLKEYPNMKDCEALEIDPDFSYSVISDEAKVFLFPDAGCC